MAMGMTYDEYWNGSSERTRAYRESWELKRRQINQQMWMQGLYMVRALNATVGNMLSDKSTKITYPEEPFPMSQQEREEQEERAKRRKFEAMKQSMIAFSEQHNQKLKEVNKNERSND